MKYAKHINGRNVALVAICAVLLAGVFTSVRVVALTINANLINTGNFDITGSISKGAGSFVIDHPLDPKNKLLYHSFVESPDVKNVYAGTVILDKNGEATVLLPDYFEALNRDFRHQLFPMGEPMPDLYVKQKVENNKFSVAGGVPFGEISWQVTGIRHDPFILANPIIPEVEKGTKAFVDKGECIYEPLCE